MTPRITNTLLILLIVLGLGQVLVGGRSFLENKEEINAYLARTRSLQSLKEGYLALTESNTLYGKGLTISGGALLLASTMLLLGNPKRQ